MPELRERVGALGQLANYLCAHAPVIALLCFAEQHVERLERVEGLLENSRGELLVEGRVLSQELVLLLKVV